MREPGQRNALTSHQGPERLKNDADGVGSLHYMATNKPSAA